MSGKPSDAQRRVTRAKVAATFGPGASPSAIRALPEIGRRGGRHSIRAAASVALPASNSRSTALSMPISCASRRGEPSSVRSAASARRRRCALESLSRAATPSAIWALPGSRAARRRTGSIKSPSIVTRPSSRRNPLRSISGSTAANMPASIMTLTVSVGSNTASSLSNSCAIRSRDRLIRSLARAVQAASPSGCGSPAPNRA